MDTSILPTVWRNGSFIRQGEAGPSIASISFHMGTGVFDGMMGYWTGEKHHIFRPQDHFSRFKLSAEKMGMAINWSLDDLCSAAYSLLSMADSQTCYIRPIAFRGGAELWLTGAESRPTDVAMFVVPTSRTINKPLNCTISEVKRLSSDAMPIKWKVCGLYVNSFLARKDAESKGFDDGIMLDQEGYVTEASAANLFIVSGGTVFTPPSDGDVFPGITRDTIFELCRELNIECTEKKLLPIDLERADAAFVSSTLMEIRPIHSVSETHMNTLGNPIYEKIWVAFDDLVMCRLS